MTRTTVASAALALALAAMGLPAAAQSRGELLYTTHCIACHDAQVHWRDRKQVIDWPSLRAQVRLWQGTAQLAWTDDDIEQVAQYLNQAYYRFAPPAPLRGQRSPLPVHAVAASATTPAR